MVKASDRAFMNFALIPLNRLPYSVRACGTVEIPKTIFKTYLLLLLSLIFLTIDYSFRPDNCLLTHRQVTH